MLTKIDIERLKESYKDNPQIEIIFKGLVETIEEAVEIIKDYAEESYNYDWSDISNEAKMFLAKYEGED